MLHWAEHAGRASSEVGPCQAEHDGECSGAVPAALEELGLPSVLRCRMTGEICLSQSVGEDAVQAAGL